MPMPDSTGVRGWVILDGCGPAAALRRGPRTGSGGAARNARV